MVRTKRPEANGATVTAGGVGRCYAEFGMTGRNDNAGWESAFLCGDEDWACMEAMGRANPEKLPCALDDDDCWADEIATNPPCDTAECWESFTNYFGYADTASTDTGAGDGSAGDYWDGPDCADEDWACFEAWGHAYPEKLPCALEGDDNCWADEIANNPPCDTAECWESFTNYFDPADTASTASTGAFVKRGGPKPAWKPAPKKGGKAFVKRGGPGAGGPAPAPGGPGPAPGVGGDGPAPGPDGSAGDY